jgi:hypothetical protein
LLPSGDRIGGTVQGIDSGKWIGKIQGSEPCIRHGGDGEDDPDKYDHDSEPVLVINESLYEFRACE